MKKLVLSCVLVLTTSLLTSVVIAEDPYQVAWTRQLGTTAYDESFGVAADGLGNIFISGWTDGSLDGANAGNDDAFVSKYDGAGNLLWTRQLGTAFSEQSHGVSADAMGNVFITGYTGGNLGGASAGGYDAFVSKYNSGGNLVWTQQLGTVDKDESWGVSVDSIGNVFIGGETFGSLARDNVGVYNDAFVSKYDDDGNLLWTRQLGTAESDRCWDVSADRLGNVFMCGTTYGNLDGSNAGNSDAFVSKYDGAGNLLWTSQLGTAAVDDSWGVSTDSLGNVFISGYTFGDLDGANAGLGDAFVSKYDSDGDLLWTRQLGTGERDESHDITTDSLGNVFISGYTFGNLGGDSAGDTDAFVSKYDSNGNLLWTQQLGTLTHDWSQGVTTDALGNVFISGYTAGDMDGSNITGGRDAFVTKFAVPEPCTLSLLALGGLLLRRRRQGVKTW